MGGRNENDLIKIVRGSGRYDRSNKNWILSGEKTSMFKDKN